jgi:hypothetical protein
MLVLAGPAMRSYSTFMRLAASCSGTPLRMGTGAPPARAPGSVQETDTRARSSNGGYPARGSGSNLIHGLERSIGGR